MGTVPLVEKDCTQALSPWFYMVLSIDLSQAKLILSVSG